MTCSNRVVAVQQAAAVEVGQRPGHVRGLRRGVVGVLLVGQCLVLQLATGLGARTVVDAVVAPAVAGLGMTTGAASSRGRTSRARRTAGSVRGAP